MRYTINDTKFIIQDGKLIKCFSEEEIIKIPDGVESIGDKVLCGLPNVKQIIFPESVTDFGKIRDRRL